MKVEVFQQLLESVKTNCPGLISEEVQKQMSNSFKEAIERIQTTASEEGYEKGQREGFTAGYQEGKRIAGQKAKAELEEVIAKCDEQAVTKLTEVLEMIDTDNTAKLQQVYQMLKDARAEGERALREQDQDYSKKLEHVAEVLNAKRVAELQAIDKDHAEKLQNAIIVKDQADAEKLQQLVDALIAKHQQQLKDQEQQHCVAVTKLVADIDENNSAKLLEAVNVVKESANNRFKLLEQTYKSKLEQQKNRKLEILSESVQKFLNYTLEKHIPKKQLVSEQKYNTALKTIDKIGDFLKVNTIIQESKDGVFSDYEKQLSTVKSQNNKLISQKIELADKLNRKEAQLVLESKLSKCTPAEAAFLRDYFKDAVSARIIQESIEDARASYKKIQQAKRAKLQQEHKVSKKPSEVVAEAREKKSEKVAKESAKQQVIVEQSEQNDIAELYAAYLTKKQYK